MSARANGTPEEQGIVKPGKGGVVPPIHARWQPGTSGNPGGVKRGTVFPAEAYKRLGAMGLDELLAYAPRNVIETGVKNALLRAAQADDWQAAHAAMKEVADRIEGKAGRKITIEQVPELRTRIATMVTALTMANENLHNNICLPDKCSCLTPEQFRAALLAPYPEQRRALVEAEIDSLD